MGCDREETRLGHCRQCGERRPRPLSYGDRPCAAEGNITDVTEGELTENTPYICGRGVFEKRE